MQLKEGIYTLEGNKFYINGKRFYIQERKKDLEKKPKQFLAHISTNSFIYISSLYPIGEGERYTFDYKQELFELEILEQGGQVEIKKLEAIQ